MSSTASSGAGILRPCGAGEDRIEVLEADVARLHHQIRVKVASELAAVVSDGWAVSAASLWSPEAPEGPTLAPDVAVHVDLGPDGRLASPPALCVTIADAANDPAAARAYARAGVNHHWHVDSRRRDLEVSIRVGSDFHLVRSLAARAPSTQVDGQGVAWLDFGVGIVYLDVRVLLG